MLLKGQVAIVTGGGRGIGRAIARRFADEGAASVVTARSEAEVEQRGRGNSEHRRESRRAVAADVSREKRLRKNCAARRAEPSARVHILVNNAGILGPFSRSRKITPREWDEVIAVNLRGAIHAVATRAAGNVRARLRRDPEYNEHRGQSGVFS